MQSTVILNFIGVGCRVAQLKVEAKEFADLHAKAVLLGESIEEAVLGSDFFDFFSGEADDDFPIVKYQGLLENEKSHVEIRINGRKKKMIFFHQLMNQSALLFPLFTMIFEVLNLCDSLIVVEKEMGAISSYKWEGNNFDIDKLHFKIGQTSVGEEKLVILQKVYYDGIELKSFRSDTLTTANYAILQ